MIVINLTDNQLILTHSEATQLTIDLESQLITAATEIIIADVPLTNDEGWQLLETIDKLLKTDNQIISWKVEGF